MKKIFTLIAIVTGMCSLFAGNPDRQGEAGAYELLMNPWARSAGFHTMNTSFISGVESIRLNVAGLARITGTEINVGYAQYFKGTSINLSSIGFGQKVGNGVFGLSVMNVDFGDLDITTTVNPEGTGATFSPSFFNLGASYAHKFDNKILVGLTLRVVSETISNVGAFAAAFDAGVQYVSGEKDNLKLGISLRNVGTKMKYRGDGLSFRTLSPDERESNTITVEHRSQGYELPSVLNLGLSYDLYIAGELSRITPFVNFTANSFSQDDLGAGIEVSFKEMLMIRGAYRYALGEVDDDFQDQVYSGLSLGASLQMPLKKDGDQRFSVDYGFRATSPFDGTHNFGISLSL